MSASPVQAEDDPICLYFMDGDLVLLGPDIIKGHVEVFIEGDVARIWIGPKLSFTYNLGMAIVADALDPPVETTVSFPMTIPGNVLRVAPCDPGRLHEYCPTEENILQLAAVDEFGCRMDMAVEVGNDTYEQVMAQYEEAAGVLATVITTWWPNGVVVPVPIPGELPPDTPPYIQTFYGVTYQLVPPHE